MATQPPYDVFVSRTTKLIALVTFVLVFAGALVTGYKASLTDPTWPTFLGRTLPARDAFTGIRAYEDSHRLIAGTTALLAIGLAVLLQWREPRRWVKVLGWAAASTVFLQALVGGVVVLLGLRYRTPVLHALLGQTYLALTVAIATVTSRWWMERPSAVHASGNAAFRLQSRWVVALLLIQVVIGAIVRHPEPYFWIHLLLHIFLGLGILGLMGWLTLRAVSEYREIGLLRKGLITADVLVLVQILLGFLSYFANRARVQTDFPRFDHVLISSLHVGTGALILGLMTFLMLCAHALLAPSRLDARAAAASARGRELAA